MNKTEQFKWEEARAAWQEHKRGLITIGDFWAIVRDLTGTKK